MSTSSFKILSRKEVYVKNIKKYFKYTIFFLVVFGITFIVTYYSDDTFWKMMSAIGSLSAVIIAVLVGVLLPAQKQKAIKPKLILNMEPPEITEHWKDFYLKIENVGLSTAKRVNLRFLGPLIDVEESDIKQVNNIDLQNGEYRIVKIAHLTEKQFLIPFINLPNNASRIGEIPYESVELDYLLSGDNIIAMKFSVVIIQKEDWKDIILV